MGPDTSLWRLSSPYDYTEVLDAPDLAWECLRRNANYQHDVADRHAPTTDTVRIESLVRQRWGLRFPGRSTSRRQRDCGLLGSGGRSRHRNPYFRLGASDARERART